MIASVVAVLLWIGLLLAGYAQTRLADPWPRDLLRDATHIRFSRERAAWKLGLLGEASVVLVAVLAASWPSLCSLVGSRVLMLVWSLIDLYFLNTRRSTSAVIDQDSDPVYRWYGSSWRLNVAAKQAPTEKH